MRDAVLLALKMEKEGGKRRNARNLEKLEKFKEMDSALEPPEETTLPRPPF